MSDGWCSGRERVPYVARMTMVDYLEGRERELTALYRTARETGDGEVGALYRVALKEVHGALEFMISAGH